MRRRAVAGDNEPPRTRIRCHELAPSIGDLPRNLAAIEAAITEAVADGVQLLVLPELATSGYYLRDANEAGRCAMPVDAPVFQEWATLLRNGLTVVLGFCENLDGILYNSSAVLTESGVVATYRKTHLWDGEKHIFTAGDDEPPIIETSVGNLGMLICYDLEFPEMPRSLAVRGADIIAVPTNWPLVPRPAGEHPPEVIQAMAAARASRIAIVCCDRAGDERGHRWTQGTSIIGPDGWLTESARMNERVDAEIEIPSDRSRLGPVNDAFFDRRPQIYSQALTSES